MKSKGSGGTQKPNEVFGFWNFSDVVTFKWGCQELLSPAEHCSNPQRTNAPQMFFFFISVCDTKLRGYLKPQKRP